ncbi:hypothetical protein WDJ51_12215 [Rathayibacter sp. YIM 133350]|uniref:hypothetical protein n=1 Tax=Rathayibacter sp. YIM 133350 TaxID=3131992 RepID=UPI00307EA1D8
MSDGMTGTGTAAGALALTGVATGWYWFLVAAVLAAIVGIILIRLSRRHSLAHQPVMNQGYVGFADESRPVFGGPAPAEGPFGTGTEDHGRA